MSTIFSVLVLAGPQGHRASWRTGQGRSQPCRGVRSSPAPMTSVIMHSPVAMTCAMTVVIMR